MVIDTREEFLKRIGEKIGDSSSDEDISFLEDMTDTYDALQSNTDQETIQRLTAENDELRKKYRERFFKPAENTDDDPDDNGDPEPKEKILSSFDDLFK